MNKSVNRETKRQDAAYQAHPEGRLAHGVAVECS